MLPDTAPVLSPEVSALHIRAPYLLFLGAVTHKNAGKTAFGLRDWCPEQCVGQLRLEGAKLDLGLTDLSIADAIAQGAKTLVIGVAPVGGSIAADWLPTLSEALASGLDIAAGLHSRLVDHPHLAEMARRHGRKLIDVRVPPSDIPIANGKKRTGKRLLTVGTDCAVGKKYTALSLARTLQSRGLSATFRATGQTGILIAGGGIPIDSTVSDFTSGAAEILSPDNHPDHWDIIEGQGSIFHPAYAAVSIGLLHGSQPDAFVVCHEAGRERITFYEAYPLPSLTTCIDRHVEAARLTNSAVKCAGVSINTKALSDDERARYLAETSERLGLPCIDPVASGADAIADFLATNF